MKSTSRQSSRWRQSFAATFAKCTNLILSKDVVNIGHYEGPERGLASNHGDPRHWFSHFGKSMDDFRRDVKALLGSAGEEKPKPILDVEHLEM